MSGPNDQATFQAAQAGSQIYYSVKAPGGTTRTFTSLMAAQRYANTVGAKVTTST